MENSTHGSSPLATGVGQPTAREEHSASRGLDTVSGATERASQAVGEATTMMKDHPYTTVAVAASLAFAVGALWKMRSNERRSRADRWAEQYMPRSRSGRWGRGLWSGNHSGNHWGSSNWGRSNGWGGSFWR